MSKAPRIVFTLLAITILFASIVVLFNITMVPRGLHLMNHINRLEFERPGTQHTWIKYITFAPLSELIFKNTGNYCDAPHFGSENGAREEPRLLVDGKNMTISFLISGHSENVFVATRERIYKELEFALDKCDPNVVGESQPLPPIHMAILYKDEQIVYLLLNKNTRTDTRIIRPGKKIDGMTSLEFAIFLEAKEQNENMRNNLQNIIQLLKQASSADM